MNLAFPALLILILASPGIILKYSYFRGSWGQALQTNSLAQDVLWGMSLSAILHIAAIWLVQWAGACVDLAAVMVLLTGPKDGRLDAAISAVVDHPCSVTAYFLGVYAGAYLLGKLASVGVRYFRLDHRWRPFRFSSDWFYLLKGEQVRLSEWRGSRPSVGADIYVYVTAVLEQGETAFLYVGQLTDFTLGKDGQLARIFLRDAKRRPLALDRRESDDHTPGGGESYYTIIGDLLILEYEHIRTLNMEYIEVSSGELPAEPPREE